MADEDDGHTPIYGFIDSLKQGRDLKSGLPYMPGKPEHDARSKSNHLEAWEGKRHFASDPNIKK